MAGLLGPRTEHLLRNAFLALLEVQHGNLAHILKMYSDKNFRQQVAFRLRNEHVRQFWLREYESYPARLRADAIAPIQNKVGAFLSNPFTARVMLHQKSSFDVREIIDKKRILLVNLAKGKIGEETAQLLGSLLISSIGQAALSRSNITEEKRIDFYLFADEFQNFTTLNFISLLAELRKYRVCLTLANQHLAQLDPKIQQAILGNTGSLICFRIGSTDAKILEQEFLPAVFQRDLINLPNRQMVLKLMVMGEIGGKFSAESLKLSSQKIP